MKDERIQKELNIIKGKVLLLLSIFVLLALLSKLLLIDTNVLYNIYVEGFILSVVLITYILRYTIFKNTEDERIQANIETLMNISFSTVFFGGIYIHFYMVSQQLAVGLISFVNFTSTFLLIGSIIFVYLLKKKSIYGNYKWIELDKKQYIIKKTKNALIFTVLLFLNMVFFLTNDSKDDLLVGLFSISFSLISLLLVYFMFALYEKNHYDEHTLLEDNQKRQLTKNAALLLFIPMVFSIVRIIFNTIFNLTILDSGSVGSLTHLSIIQRVLNIYSIDVSILTLLSYIVIYRYLKETLKCESMVFTIAKIYIYFFLTMTIITSINIIISPLISILLRDSIETFIMINKIFTTLSYVSMLVFLAFHIYFAIYMQRNNITSMYLFWLFTVTPVIGYMVSSVSFLYNLNFLAILSGLISSSTLVLLFIFFKKQDRQIRDVIQIERSNEDTITRGDEEGKTCKVLECQPGDILEYKEK